MLDIQKGVEFRLHVREKLGLKGAYSLSGLLNKANPYINYEEELLEKIRIREWETQYKVNI